MGLTDNQKRLIMELADKNIMGCRKAALECLNEDTTSKNRFFCEKYKSILNDADLHLMEVPYNLQGILYLEDVKETFQESQYYITEREKKVFEQIVRMQKVSEKLKQMGLKYLNSSILYGKSGTGKTSFGKYLAHNLNLPFCYVKFSKLMDSFLGGTPKNISKIFEFASSIPCVFMLDEIDCISIKRSDISDGGASAEMGRVTITLMQEMDRLSSDVIMIAATNRMDRIDEALLRRFSLKHEVLEMTEEERNNMAMKFLDNLNFQIPQKRLEELVKKNKNQSMLINEIIREIAELIEKEM